MIFLGISQRCSENDGMSGDLMKYNRKPENMLEKIASGRLKKFFKENTLVNQIYIKDSKMTVGQYLKEIDVNLSIVSFERVSLT